MFEAAEYNEISAMIGLTDLMNARLVQNHLQAIFSPLAESVYQVALSPLIHHSNEKLVKMVNDGFTSIDIQDLIRIEERWLNEGDHYYQRLVKKVALTKEERDFVNQEKAIRVGMVTDLSPMEFVNKAGKFDGINRDVLDVISQRSDLQFEYVGFDSWQQLYQAMLSEEIDILSGITPTEQRKEHLLFSDSYWQMPWVIIHPQYLGKQTKLPDFHGKQIAIVKGYYLIEQLRKQHPLVTFKLVDNRQQALLALQQERVDGFITTIASATQLLKQDQIITMMISIMESVSLDQSHFGINKNAPLLKTIIDKGLATLSDREKQRIYDSWFSLAINTGLDKNVVLRVAAQIGIIILLIFVVFVMWNRRLQIEIKHREQLEKIMKHMATHDELTGLANRVLLKDRLNTAIAFHQRQSLQMAVLFMDLDGFKTINDSYGHDVGDEMLKEVALRLQGCVRESDTVVRFGGDEFVLLLTGLHSKNEASYVAEKVLKLMQSEFELSKSNAYIGCSIGIAMYPGDGSDDIDLLKVADTLMYKVKAAGKNHYIFS
jgi:diguanylate cyclase (GGDEF)-like protein